jgi:hypothetical protein
VKTTVAKQYRRKEPQKQKRMAGGILAPRQEFVVALDPPMKPNEQPVVITPQPGDILLRDVTPESVTVVNYTDRIVAYFLTVVPSIYVQAAQVPWVRVFTDVGHALRNSNLLEQINNFFSRRLPK